MLSFVIFSGCFCCMFKRKPFVLQCKYSVIRCTAQDHNVHEMYTTWSCRRARGNLEIDHCAKQDTLLIYFLAIIFLFSLFILLYRDLVHVVAIYTCRERTQREYQLWTIDLAATARENLL